MRLSACLLAITVSAWGADLAGRVIEDHTGTPLPSANVRITRQGEAFLAADLETDREGRFQAPGLAAGRYQVEVLKPNFAGTRMAIVLGAADTNLTLRLVRRGVITGRVIDPQGRPVVGVNVTALPKPPAGAPLRPAPRVAYNNQLTDTKGEYRLRDLPVGEYAIVASWGASTRAIGGTGTFGTPPALGSGFLFYPTNARPQFLVISSGEQHRNIDFTVLAGQLFTVSGKVEPSDAQNRYWLGLILEEQPAMAVAIAQAAVDGSFSFPGIPSGAYRLVASKTNGARNTSGGLLADKPTFAESRVQVGGSDVTGLIVRPTAPASVEFVLRPASGCPAAATLNILPLEDWGMQIDKQVPLNSGATAKVEGLPPARYTIAATDSANVCYLESEVIVDLSKPPAQPVEVKLAPAASIRGKLDTGGRPPTGFSILLAPVEDAAQVHMATPNAQAIFEFAGIKPGRYRIGVFPAGQKTPQINLMVEFELRGGSNAQIDLAAPREVQ